MGIDLRKSETPSLMKSKLITIKETERQISDKEDDLGSL